MTGHVKARFLFHRFRPNVDSTGSDRHNHPALGTNGVMMVGSGIVAYDVSLFAGGKSYPAQHFLLNQGGEQAEESSPANIGRELNELQLELGRRKVPALGGDQVGQHAPRLGPPKPLLGEQVDDLLATQPSNVSHRAFLHDVSGHPPGNYTPDAVPPV